MATEATLFDGKFMVEAVLRHSRRSATAEQQAAIDKALADDGFVTDIAAQVMKGLPPQAPNAPLPFSGFLALLLQMLPQILALISALFGIPIP